MTPLHATTTTSAQLTSAQLPPESSSDKISWPTTENSLNQALATKPDTLSIFASNRCAEFSFYFHVSQNEEHTSLTICDEHGKTLRLGERVHHYVLLTLARQRLADHKRGLEQTSQGWLEIAHLMKMLGMDSAHLNIQIYRVRQQIALALKNTAEIPEFIERRRGEIRLASVQFCIIRGACLEGEIATAGASTTNRNLT